MHFSVFFRIGRIFVYNFVESDDVHLLWHSVYNWDLASSWVWQKGNSQDDIIHEDMEAYTRSIELYSDLFVWRFCFLVRSIFTIPFAMIKVMGSSIHFIRFWWQCLCAQYPMELYVSFLLRSRCCASALRHGKMLCDFIDGYRVAGFQSRVLKPSIHNN